MSLNHSYTVHFKLVRRLPHRDGFHIAKGTHTTTMMANDLPNVEVACENCHSAAPHKSNPELADCLNRHVEKITCQTCHIPFLHPDNATYRDFSSTPYEERPGIYVYTDSLKETEPGKGIVHVWWNGDGTFPGNPIGDNPKGQNLYRFCNPTHTWPEYKNFDYAGWYVKVMRSFDKKGMRSRSPTREGHEAFDNYSQAEFSPDLLEGVAARARGVGHCLTPHRADVVHPYSRF